MSMNHIGSECIKHAPCDVLQVPMAKASIYWLVGEYCSLVPKIAPDVLRKAAKAFPNEVHMHMHVHVRILLDILCMSKDGLREVFPRDRPLHG